MSTIHWFLVFSIVFSAILLVGVWLFLRQHGHILHEKPWWEWNSDLMIHDLKPTKCGNDDCAICKEPSSKLVKKDDAD